MSEDPNGNHPENIWFDDDDELILPDFFFQEDEDLPHQPDQLQLLTDILLEEDENQIYEENQENHFMAELLDLINEPQELLQINPAAPQFSGEWTDETLLQLLKDWCVLAEQNRSYGFRLHSIAERLGASTFQCREGIKSIQKLWAETKHSELNSLTPKDECISLYDEAVARLQDWITEKRKEKMEKQAAKHGKFSQLVLKEIKEIVAHLKPGSETLVEEETQEQLQQNNDNVYLIGNMLTNSGYNVLLQKWEHGIKEMGINSFRKEDWRDIGIELDIAPDQCLRAFNKSKDWARKFCKSDQNQEQPHSPEKLRRFLAGNLYLDAVDRIKACKEKREEKDAYESLSLLKEIKPLILSSASAGGRSN